MLGLDGLCATASLEGLEEGECETPSDCKRKRRQSVGGERQAHLWRHSNLLSSRTCLNVMKHKLWVRLFGAYSIGGKT